MANDYLGNLKFMGQDEDKNFLVEVEIVRSGPNRNGWDFQNMNALCNTFLGTPLLCAYLPNRVGDGHNFREATLPSGEEILDFTGPTAERIVGMISENPEDIWTEEREDGTWAVARGKIWRFYNRQLVDKLALQGGMAVSAEIETHGGYTNDEGIEVYDDWTGLGVTLLHESVPPAVPGAHIQAIRAMSEEFKEMKFKAASYHPNATDEQGIQGDEGGNNTNEMNDKGVNHTMSFNRREAERLAPKFEGYTIVGLSEDSKNVILMSETGGLFSYTFNEEYGEGVVAEAIAPVKNVSVMCGETPADLDEIVKAMSATISESKATITNLNAQIETLNSENEALKTAEHDRRIEMVKASVHKALEDIAESCDNAENCDNEAAEIEGCAEDYAQMESDGKFCGDKAAYEKLMSVFGEKVAKARKANNAKNKAQFAWNMSAGKADEGGVASLVAKFNGVNQ